MTSKEVPKEVQFCSAIACGDADAAKELLPEINPSQKIDFDINIISDTLKKVFSLDTQASSLALRLLHNIVTVAPIHTQGEQERFIQNCCVAALEFIKEANNVGQPLKAAASKLCDRLKHYGQPKSSQILPDCMQKLMSYLNEDAEDKALFPSNQQPHSYLPNQQRIAQLTEQIREERQRSPEQDKSASADNLISFLIPSQRQH